jgi:hypothetical protein
LLEEAAALWHKGSMKTSQQGRVASLHLHPATPGAPLNTVEQIELVKSKGILGEPRYFGRVSRETSQPSKRQVSLIEQEQIAEHAATLELQSIPPGAVRSNIETVGINLVALVGSEIEIGEAVLFLYAPRDPCAKMDAICQGLRELMLNNRQGVMAQVVRSGKVRVGDRVMARQLQPAAGT